MAFWNNPAAVRYTPVITVVLLEVANIGQIVRMWRERTAAGQSLTSWLSVGLALVLWWNFYRVVTPNEKIARWSAACGIAANAGVWLSVIYWRYLA